MFNRKKTRIKNLTKVVHDLNDRTGFLKELVYRSLGQIITDNPDYRHIDSARAAAFQDYDERLLSLLNELSEKRKKAAEDKELETKVLAFLGWSNYLRVPVTLDDPRKQ